VSAGARPFTLLLVLLALTALAWPDLFLKSQVPVDGNVLRLFYPNWAFLHAHPPGLSQWPLWNPYRNMGEPFLADPQSLAGYPPMWLLCRLPSYLGFVRFWILGHTLLAGYFMRQWMLRSLGDHAAAAAATVVMAFNGYFVAHGTLLNHFAAAAYVPAALYYFSADRPTALGAVLALQWLAGFPPFSYLTGVALVCWMPFLWPARARFLACLWKAGILALGIAAFQVIPFVELFAHATRPALLSADVATEFSEPAGQLLRMFVLPQWLVWSQGLTGDQAVVTFYVGPFVCFLAAWALFKGGRRERAIVLATIVFAALSLGSHLPGYSQLFPLHIFRFPANWLLLSTVGFALLSAWGVARMPDVRWRWTVAALIALDLVAFARQGRTPWFSPSFLSEPPALAQSLIAAAGTSRVYHSPAVVQRLSQQTSKSFTDWLRFKDALIPSYGTAFGLREVSSYQVLKLTRAAQFQERLAIEGPASPLARWAGIGAVIVTIPGADPSEVPQVQAVRLKDANLPLVLMNSPSTGHVTLLRYQAGHVAAQVVTERPDLLVFSEVSYPGWTAYVDGQPQSSDVFQSTFQAVQIQPGHHVVRFEYAPLTFRIGLVISLATLPVLGFGLIFRLVLVRRPRA
jgi:hypothetical protein